MVLNPTKIKLDFPILARKINQHCLVYLDNAATSQKPQVVIDAISNYYAFHNANVHRGVHQLSDESSALFETSRQIIANFFGAKTEELILVSNTTQAINGVAYAWANDTLKKGDVILTTIMEHHSNFVVWQEVCKKTGVKLEFLTVDQNGRLNLSEVKEKLKKYRPKLFALAHVSNTTGVINPIAEILQLIKSLPETKNITKVLLDAAQSAPHLKINFKQLNVDFLVFSGHKMLGPMGIGGLLVKQHLLQTGEFKPWLFGGGMIFSVAKEQTVFNSDIQEKFSAGTPDVASTVGLAAACEYLTNLGFKDITAHDYQLVEVAINKLSAISEINIIGPTQLITKHETNNTHHQLDRIGSVAFIYQGVHAHDVAQILDGQGIAVRSGHHCTMPLHTYFGWQATTRVSFQVYNSLADIDKLVAGLKKVKQVFS